MEIGCGKIKYIYGEVHCQLQNVIRWFIQIKNQNHLLVRTQSKNRYSVYEINPEMKRRTRRLSIQPSLSITKCNLLKYGDIWPNFKENVVKLQNQNSKFVKLVCKVVKLQILRKML